MNNQGRLSIKIKRASILLPAIAEQLEDRRLLSVNLPAWQSAVIGPYASPDATPADTGPTVVTAASATPASVNGTTTNLSVLGDDSAGESNLTYTWATLATPPAAVVFSVNGTNAAKNTTATFSHAGAYSFQVTLADGSGLTAASNVNVVVNQTATSVVVTTPTITVAAGTTTQLSATELDQFGTAMTTQPAFVWSVTSGGGSVSTSGVYTAATAGSATVSAADASGPVGTATLTVAAPVVSYQMNASSGTTLVDSSGNNQTASLTGNTYFNTGYTGNAVDFDGGYATLPTGIVSSLNDFTIAAWVNIPTLTSGAHIFDFGSGTNDYMYLTADSNSTGGLTFGISTGGQAAEQQVNGPMLSGGAWEHLAVTLAGNQATLYVNGTSVASGTISLTPSSLGSTTLNYLGKSQFSTDPALYGSIDDFRIYPAALSAQQVQQVAGVSLPTGWTDSDIGAPAIPGGAFFDASTNVWTLNSSGSDISNTSDQFNFASTSLTGDLVLTAEVTQVGDSSQYAQGGLMIRSSLAADAVSIALLMTPDSGIEMLTRTSEGQVSQYGGREGISGPVWLQLDRYGTTVSGYFSNDDVHWYSTGNPVSLSSAGPVLAGLASTSHTADADDEATFSNVSVAPNAAPTIAAPAAVASTTFTGYSTAVSVLAADDAGEQNLDYSWAYATSGSGRVYFADSGTNTAKVTQATFTASGTYDLMATATDAGGYTVESSVVVTVAVPPLPPNYVMAVWSGSAVDLSWQISANAAAYNIYRATTVGGEGSTVLASTGGDTFVDTNVTAGVQYYYQVTAVSSDGLESSRSFETASLAAAYTTPIISEFMAQNNTTLTDAAGGYPDWLELYNPTATTLTLTGDYLTNSTKTLNDWAIPTATLAPGAFLVVFADSINQTDSAGAFHTNFNLGASGGYLALVGGNGISVLSSYTYPQQVSDVSYGIGMSQTIPTSYGGVGFLTPTPGAINSSVIATGITAQPTFNYPSGFYSTSMQVQIASTTPGALIYYTLDGTQPSATNGTLYTGRITVSGETNIRAIAVAPEYLPSSSSAVSYIYLSQVVTQAANGQAPAGWPVDWGYSLVHYGMDPSVVNNSAYSSEITQDLLDLPSVSLTMNLQDLFDPETGIYSESQLSQGWDRAGSIALINPGGAAGFQDDVAVSLKGDSSAAIPDSKHGFDIKFSSEYGASELDYPLFGASAAQSFKEIQLRTDQESSWSFSYPATYIGIRDEFTSSLLAAVNQPAEHYKVCFLYIDGMFWGLYDIIEKPDANYAASYFGETAASYDSIKATNVDGGLGVEAEDGNLNAWDQLYTDISTLDLTNNANYEMIQGNNPDGTKNSSYPDLLDVNNLINYMLVIDYVGNTDGPYNNPLGPNNFYAIRPTDGSFGFKFIATDSESTLIDVNVNVVDLSPLNISPADSATPAYFFGMLQENPEFRIQVGDAVQKDFSNNGPMSVSATSALFQSLASVIQDPVVGESARWGDTLRPGEAYTRDDDWQPLINSMLSDYFPQRTAIVIGQLQAVDLYPLIAAPTFSQYGGAIASGFQLTMSQTGAGTIYYTQDGSDPQNADGSIASTALAYTGAIALFATTEVKARVLSNGAWSALVDETFIASASNVRITQLNYDPGKPPTGSSYNNDDFEFVELENVSGQSVNLDGVAFTNGIKYTFGNVTLGAWQSGVLVHNLAAFQSRYGTAINVLGNYLSTGESFSNSGEEVELVDAAGNVLDQFDYTSCVAAFPTAHGKGASLIALNPDGMVNLNLSSGWMASTVTNGTVPLLLGTTPTYLKLDSDGVHIDIWNAANDSGTPAELLAIAGLTSITFNAAAAGDSLTVDLSNGNPVSAVPLYYNGGATLSAMMIVGSTSADTLTVNGSSAILTNSAGSASVYYSASSIVTFNGNGGADTVDVTGGTFSFAASTSGLSPISLGTLSISAGGTASLIGSATAGNRNVLVINNFLIAGSGGAWTGKLDLGNNDVIIKGGNLTDIASELASGFNAGQGWNGTGIVSSAAAGTDMTALGYEIGGNLFDGVVTTTSDVVIKYTYFGDANLDGKVDGSDYSLIDNGYLTHATGWWNGDFNYDGVINGSDYTLIDNAFNSQGASLAAEVSDEDVASSLSTKTQKQARSSFVADSLFQTRAPISFPTGANDSVEQLMQARDLLDRLNLLK